MAWEIWALEVPGVVLGPAVLLDAFPDGRYLVVLVVDQVVALEADGLPVVPEGPGAEGVEGADSGVPFVLSGQLGSPLGHLVGGLVGEGHCEYGPGVYPQVAGQVGYPVGDDPGLAAAWAGNDEDGALGGEDGLPLRGIEVFQKVFRLGHLGVSCLLCDFGEVC